MNYLLSTQFLTFKNVTPNQKAMGDVCFVDYLEG